MTRLRYITAAVAFALMLAVGALTLPGSSANAVGHGSLDRMALSGQDGANQFGEDDLAVPGDPQPPAQTKKLSLLTWNIKGGSCDNKLSGQELNSLVVELQHRTNIHNLDVLALQEIHRDQARRIAEAVGFLHLYFSPTIICGGDRPNRGNVIISRYPFENRKTHQFFYKHPEEDERRNVIGVSIRVGGRVISIYTTHLTARGESSNPNFYRAQQAGECVDFINESRAILMGDFNAERRPLIDFSHNPYAVITNRFRDAWAIWAKRNNIPINDSRGYTNPTGGNSQGGPNYHPPSKRIDYIFLRKGSRLDVVAAGVLRGTRQLSDHFPVIAHLSFD